VGGLQWLLIELTDTDIYAAEDEQNPDTVCSVGVPSRHSLLTSHSTRRYSKRVYR